MEPLNGVALGYGLDNRGFESRQGVVIYLFTTTSRPGLGPIHPPVQWVPGALSLVVKRKFCEADHSSISSAGVKNAWSYKYTPPIVFMAWCLVNYRILLQGVAH